MGLGLFLGGAATGAASGYKLAQQYKDAQMQNALAEAATTNRTQGVMSGSEAEQNFLANYQQQAGGPTAQEALDAYKASAPDAYANEIQNRQGGYESGPAGGGGLQRTFATQPEAQTATRGANMQAMADVYGKFGKPEEQLKLEEQVQEGKLKGLQLKEAERANKYAEGLPELQASSNSAKIAATNKEIQDKYVAEVDRRKTMDPVEAANLPPLVAPVPVKYDVFHAYEDAAKKFAYDAKFGKGDPAQMVQLLSSRDKATRENLTNAIHVADSGGNNVQIANEYSKSGEKISPDQITTVRNDVSDSNGKKQKSYDITVTHADGRVDKFQSHPALLSMLTAEQAIDVGLKERQTSAAEVTAQAHKVTAEAAQTRANAFSRNMGLSKGKVEGIDARGVAVQRDASGAFYTMERNPATGELERIPSAGPTHKLGGEKPVISDKAAAAIDEVVQEMPKKKSTWFGNDEINYQRDMDVYNKKMDAALRVHGVPIGGPNDPRGKSESTVSEGTIKRSDIPTVKSKAEADALPKGTQFYTPDGRLKVR